MSSVATPVHVSPDSLELRGIARAAAERHGVPAHEVLVRLLLHLPRLADAEARVDGTAAGIEGERLAHALALRTAAYAGWQELHSPPTLRATDLVLSSVPEATARIVLERFHYLQSFRPTSEHIGGAVRDGGAERLVAMLTLSSLDVPPIAANLPTGVLASEVAMLSRVFAFEFAPPNTLSFLMGRTMRLLRRRDQAPRLLVTYLNPNVGFTGASYRASNWILWAREAGTRYAYLDEDYITDRELERRFASSDPGVLAARLKDRIAFSKMPLAPLDLYAYPLDVALRPSLSEQVPSELPRPTP